MQAPGKTRAIEVGAGPSVIRNNLVLGNKFRGISTYDYNNRGYFNNVEVSSNTATLYEGSDIGVTIPSVYIPANLTIVNNLALTLEGGKGFDGLPTDDLGWFVSNNETLVVDKKLEKAVKDLIAAVPTDPDSVAFVWPHLRIRTL